MTYLVTLCCYGAHLPGDARGWVERTRNGHGGGWREPSSTLERHSRKLMQHPPYILNHQASQIVLATIQEVCGFRNWHLCAAHVRSNHVHCVVKGVVQPHRAISDFKSYSSRALNLLEGSKERWARSGNAQALTCSAAIQAAIRYVVDGQGESMAVYVWRREDGVGHASPLLRVGLH